MMRYLILSSFFLLSFTFANSQDITTGEYLPMTYTSNETTLNYRILYPEGFDETKKYPLVLFLHGRGESGDDNVKQLVHGSQLFIDNMEKYPAIVLFPQCPVTDYWANIDRKETKNGLQFKFYSDREPNPSLAAVIALTNDFLEKPFIDVDRLYVTGLSMGGMGTWELLGRMPEKIAAAAPICGGGSKDLTPKMINVPIWAFHGVKDDVVPARYSIMMVEGVQKAGGKAKITLYPNANHNSWDPTFNDPKYLTWLFKHKRN